MLKKPTKTVQAINNRVTVSLPLMQFDTDEIAGKIKLEELRDVDIVTEGKTDGVVLVYDANTDTWKSTRLLQKQVMDGGEY